MAFISTPCRLQTSVTEVTDTKQIDVHPVFAQNQIPVGVIEKFSNLPVNVVSLAWAILLRSYVLSDTVSFALFSWPQEEALHGSEDENTHVFKSRAEDQNVSVCQYHMDSDRKWEDWSPDANQDLSLEAIKNTQINTAIRQWSSGDLDRHQSLYPRSEGSILFVSANFFFVTSVRASAVWPSGLWSYTRTTEYRNFHKSRLATSHLIWRRLGRLGRSIVA